MSHSYRIFLSTGEVSGDLQGSWLTTALLAEAKIRGYSLEIMALGGPQMAAQGATLLADTSQIGAIGPINAVPFIWPTLKLQRQVEAQLGHVPPDLTVLIDYVGPNLRLGKRLKQQLQMPVVYYIAPPEWIWSQGLKVTQQVVSLSDKMLAIFPQEAAYFAKMGAEVCWVGHPLLDEVQQAPSRQLARQHLGLSLQQPMITLMPASRRQELHHILPVVIEAAQRIIQQIPEVQFWLPLALPAYRQVLAQAIEDSGLPISLSTETHTVLAASDMVIAKSGTANLEAALLDVPQVVVYRLGAISAWLYQHLLKFKVDFISPVNIVAGTEIVPELFQQAANPGQIAELACKLLLDHAARQRMLEGYQQVRSQLGPPGVVQRAAQEILNILEQS